MYTIMKLLFENWRGFLKEQNAVTAAAKRRPTPPLPFMDPDDIKTPAVANIQPREEGQDIPEVQISSEIQIHNASILMIHFLKRSGVSAVFEEGWPKLSRLIQQSSGGRRRIAKKLIDYIVFNNPIFHNNKLLEYLGAGTFGFVFRLDNDHALKIFVGSFDAQGIDSGNWMDRDAKSDTARYKDSQEKAFAGTGQSGELMIYDQGRIKTPGKKDWHYAEMQQLKTLSSWSRYVHKIDELDPAAVKEFNIKLDAEIDALKLYADEHSWSAARKKSAKRFARWSIPQARFMDSLRYLDKKYAKNLLEQLKEILKTKTLKDIRDIRGANIGVSQQDESLPIIFDY